MPTTARLDEQHALSLSEERYRSLMMLSADWCWEQDEQFRFTGFSGNGYNGTWRRDQKAAIGKCRWALDGVHPVDSTWEQHRAVLEAHQPFRDFRHMRVLDGDSLHYVSSNGEPVFDADGQFSGYRGTARDITVSMLAEQRLRDAQAMLHMAAQIGRLGAWGFDLSESHVTWSEEVCAIHEVPQGFAPTPEQAVAFYAPEYQDTLCNILMACVRDGSPFDVETQIITAKGRCVWVRAIGEAEWDAQGRVRRIQCTCQTSPKTSRRPRTPVRWLRS